MKLIDVIKIFNREKINYLVVGGYAVNYHGYSRNTVDIDFVIKHSLSNFKKLEKALNELGLISKLPVDAVSVFKFKEEYIKNRNMLVWNFYDPNDPFSQVDILITQDVSDFKGEKFETNGEIVKVVSKEDLIKMKKKAGRPKDLLDIKELQK